MLTKQPVIFCHIPKSGGTSLRIVLNKVYGEENVFFIESKNIAGSLEEFKALGDEKRSQFQVIAGHGAEMFSGFFPDPFFITILREPVSLFLSQYYYLRKSENSVFLNDVRALQSVEEYLDYAIANGQDNLMTRYLSHSMGWLVDKEIPIPDMNVAGEDLLVKAFENLSKYDAALDLADFDTGVYALYQMLEWNHIPVYRPANITSGKADAYDLPEHFIQKLENTLRFDILLYKAFLRERMDVAHKVNRAQVHFRQFQMRQFFTLNALKLSGKK